MSTQTRIRTDSLLSLNPSELFDDDSEYRHLCRLFEKQFGEGIFGPSKKTVTFSTKRSARRLQHLNPFRKTGYTEVYQNKNGYKVTLDVQQFKVGELTIKAVDQCIVIEGKHKDRKDYHGFISRSFTRKFFLPKNMDPSTLSAKLSLDGLLAVTAVSKEMPAPRVRVIDICCTRKRALTTSPPIKGPAKPAVKPAVKPAGKPAAKQTAKPSQQRKYNKGAKPKPRPQRNGPANTPKPQAGGSAKLQSPSAKLQSPSAKPQLPSAKPQQPMQSGKAQ